MAARGGCEFRGRGSTPGCGEPGQPHPETGAGRGANCPRTRDREGQEGPEGPPAPRIRAAPPSKSILPSPSVSATWVTASASSSVRGAMDPAYWGWQTGCTWGRGWARVRAGGAPGRHPTAYEVLAPHVTVGETEPGAAPFPAWPVGGWWGCPGPRTPLPGCCRYLISFHSMKPLLSLSSVWNAFRMTLSSCPEARNFCMYSKNLTQRRETGGDWPCHPGLRARAGRPGRRGLGPEGDSCPGAGAAGPCALPQPGGSCVHGSRPQWAARRYRGASHRRAAGLCPCPTGTRPWPTPSPSSGRRNCRPSWPCGHGEPSAGCWAGDGTLPGRCAAPDPKRRLSPVSWWPAPLRGYPLPSRDRP